MKDVTISSNSRFYGEVRMVKEKLEDMGLSVFTPDLDFDETEICIDYRTKHKLTFEFLHKIRNSKCLLVITNEEGYVGNSVSLEVGYAHGIGHPIFCLYPISEPAVACLCKKIKNLYGIISALEGF